MNQNSINFRSIVKTIQVIIKFEQDEEKKLNCNDILQKFIESKETSLIKSLDKQNQIKLIQIRTAIKYFRNAFMKTTQKKQYKHLIVPSFPITDFLINLQDKIDPNDLRTSYLRAITVNKKSFNWSKEFIQDWFKAYDQEIIAAQQNQKQKILEKTQFKKKQPQQAPQMPKNQPQLSKQQKFEQKEITHYFVQTKPSIKDHREVSISREKEVKKPQVDNNGHQAIEKRKTIKKTFKSKKELLKHVVVELDSDLDEYILEFGEKDQQEEKLGKKNKKLNDQK